MQHATVDTFIVTRSLTPLLVLPLETVTNRWSKNRENNGSSSSKTSSNSSSDPSIMTYMSLIMIALSALGYAIVEHGGEKLHLNFCI